MRFSGKRTVGPFTPFDLPVLMLPSEAVSASLSGGDDSVPAGLLRRHRPGKADVDQALRERTVGCGRCVSPSSRPTAGSAS